MITRGLLANKDARRYLAGQVLSLLGDSAMWLACGIWVKTLTGSNSAAGLTFLFFSIPTLLAPLGGLLVDRVRRKPLLVISNLAGALIVTPLFLVNDSGDVWIIYTVMLLYGALNVLIAPAQSALLAVLLPDDLRPSANAFLRTAQEGLRIVAPLAGAGLFAVLGGRFVVALDIITFVAAALFTLSLSIREPHPKESAAAAKAAAAQAAPTTPGARLANFGRDLSAGITYLWKSRLLRGITLATAVATLVIGFSDSANYAVVEGLLREPEFLGVLQTIQGVGAVVGGLTATMVIKRFGEVKVAAFGVSTFALGPLLMAIPVLPVALTGKVFSGIGLPWMAIAILTLFQRVAPNHLQGRVFTALELLTSAPHTVSIGVGAALIAAFDYRWVLLGEGLVLLLSAWALIAFTRSAPEPAPDEDDSGPPVPHQREADVATAAIEDRP